MSAATVEAKVEQLLEADERRAARDSYRAAGGSKRRPLKSFRTQREKRELREEHAALIREAVDALREPAEFERWIEALELNPHLTPLNAALVAMQTPGEIVSTCAQWRRQGYRVRKGETAAGRITGKGFWPLTYFTAEQANAGDLDGFEVELPDDGLLTLLRAELVARLDRGDKGAVAVAEVAALRTAGEFVPTLPPEPEVDGELVLEAVAKWRARLAEERAACDRELAALAAGRTVAVSRIAARIGVSRQAVYQLADA
jgi:hypothetical protein